MQRWKFNILHGISIMLQRKYFFHSRKNKPVAMKTPLISPPEQSKSSLLLSVCETVHTGNLRKEVEKERNTEEEQ